MSIEEHFILVFMKNYAVFLFWLGSLGLGIKRVNGPLPRLRGNQSYPDELCARIFVEKKLPNSELADDWDVLYNAYQSGEPLYNVKGAKPPKIPHVLAGWPTDIVEESTR